MEKLRSRRKLHLSFVLINLLIFVSRSNETGNGTQESFSREHKSLFNKTLEAFGGWAEQQFGGSFTLVFFNSVFICPLADEEANGEEDSQAGVTAVSHGGKKGMKKDLWPLEEDEDGHTILPVFDSNVKLPDLKDIIRSFVSHAYRKQFYLLF
jgi:hypothetical protein